MFELRHQVITSFFRNPYTRRKALLEFDVEECKTPEDICYHILLQHLNNHKITKNDYSLLRENLEQLSPVFACYLALRFKNKICDTDTFLQLVGQTTDQEYLSFHSCMIYRFSLTKKDCVDDECYKISRDFFQIQDYLDAAHFVLKNQLHPVLMEYYLVRNRNRGIDKTFLKYHLETFCIFHDSELLDKVFKLEFPTWKYNLTLIRKHYNII